MHKEAGWMGDVRDAFQSFPFEAPFETALQTTTWGEWWNVNWIRKTLADKGLQDVEVDVYAFLSHVDSADFFLTNCGVMMDWVVNSCWPEELRKAHPKEEIHGLVKEFLEKKYGGEGWKLSWVVAVATGRVPS
jgi:hypothetical protein